MDVRNLTLQNFFKTPKLNFMQPLRLLHFGAIAQWVFIGTCPDNFEIRTTCSMTIQHIATKGYYDTFGCLKCHRHGQKYTAQRTQSKIQIFRLHLGLFFQTWANFKVAVIPVTLIPCLGRQEQNNLAMISSKSGLEDFFHDQQPLNFFNQSIG